VAVKPVQAVTRALAVLDAVAQHEPVGVAALGRILGEDTSAVQRSLVSLHDAGWIRAATGTPVRWELSLRVFALGARAADRSGLRERAHPLLESLRDATGESAFLVEVDDTRLVVIDVVESRQVVRAAPALGLSLPVARSASGRAVLAHLDDDTRAHLVGGPVDVELRAELATVAKRGWSVSAGLVGREQTSVGAAVLDAEARAVGALVVTGPRDRVPPKLQKVYGALVAQAAVTLTSA